MFDERDRKIIHLAWNDFINQKKSIYKVRPEIYDSWERSRMYGIDIKTPKKTILDKRSLDMRIAKNQAMIEISKPIMSTLAELVEGSGFQVVLVDAQGYILHMLGDEDIGQMAKKNMLAVGANRSETSVGTNAIGTCLFLNQPIQIWADEHYVNSHKLWACSAAPIHNPQGILLGCISITGPWQKVHSHTLGMVVSTAKAIEKQMEMQAALNAISTSNSQMDAILESISSGIILIDNQGIITQVNKNAIQLLRLQGIKLVGEQLDKVIRYDKSIIDILNVKKNIYDQEIKLETETGILHCAANCTIVQDEYDEKQGVVMTFKEIKHVRKLINTMTGSHARFTFENIAGSSPAILNVIEQAKMATRSPSNVLLTGESGTGKEMFAQSIHNNSDRANGPFIAINCGALPRGLIESELFGYEGGSFTGAKKSGHPGKLELADGGTLFLDEIGDMPLDVQVSLLRFLQNREIERIGGKRSIPVDVRVIAATNKNLEECVENNTFRYDLFYRLNVLSINIPPLRERKSDVSILTNHFFNKYKNSFKKNITGISSDVYEYLYRYDWPGNIRQLENTIERAVNVTTSEYIQVQDLPDNIRISSQIEVFPEPTGKENAYTQQESQPSTESVPPKKIKEFEREAIINALKSSGGNVKKSSEILGFSRRTIYRKFEQYNIDHRQYK